MTCEKCYHNEVCKALYELNRIPRIGATECAYFRDKDHLLELPCAVGDAVYRVSFVNKKVEMLKVEGFLRNLASWKVHCTHFIPSWLANKKEHIYIPFSSFGKTVFLTLGEAEKRLAEMEAKYEK